VSDVYEFIDAEYATRDNAPGITQMCAWLEVSKSGFYDWRSRPESATAKRQERLRLLIKKVFDDSDGTYGYRRIAQLALWGVQAGAELVRRLMRQLGLVACQPRPWRPSTTKRDLRDFKTRLPPLTCGFVTSSAGLYAAFLYSLISPPRTRCRRTFPSLGPATEAGSISSGRGGRRSRARCGRCWL
jgi:hypothetical protein